MRFWTRRKFPRLFNVIATSWQVRIRVLLRQLTINLESLVVGVDRVSVRDNLQELRNFDEGNAQNLWNETRQNFRHRQAKEVIQSGSI